MTSTQLAYSFLMYSMIVAFFLTIVAGVWCIKDGRNKLKACEGRHCNDIHMVPGPIAIFTGLLVVSLSWGWLLWAWWVYDTYVKGG